MQEWPCRPHSSAKAWSFGTAEEASRVVFAAIGLGAEQ